MSFSGKRGPRFHQTFKGMHRALDPDNCFTAHLLRDFMDAREVNLFKRRHSPIYHFRGKNGCFFSPW